jgi:DNA-binding NarL/FixJ family response regulator
VRSGGTFFSPEIARRLKDARNAALRAGRPVDEPVELTARETQTLELIAKGLRNKEIAHEMAVSIKTVEKHRQGVMNKLNIHDAAGLTRYALTKGMVSATGNNAKNPVGI